MNNNILETLTSFVDRAVKSRKYAPETAGGLKVAIRSFYEVLNEDERSSIQLVQDRFDQIYNAFFARYISKMTDVSIKVYKKRFLKVLHNYLDYGIDANNFTNWQVKERKPVHRRKTTKDGIQQHVPVISIGEENVDKDTFTNKTSLLKNEIPLRMGTKAIVLFPEDLTYEDVTKLEAYITYLKMITPKEG